MNNISGFTVYSHRNNINNKVYIGITSRNPESRWLKGEGYKDQPRFYTAINKYGWDNFTHSILYENLSEEEACLKEKELIEVNNSTNPKFGYNVIAGGRISSTDKTIYIYIKCGQITELKKNLKKKHLRKKLNFSGLSNRYQHIVLLMKDSSH